MSGTEHIPVPICVNRESSLAGTELRLIDVPGTITDMTDEALIREIAGGDRDAFRHLVKTYQERVLNTCWQMLGRREDAEDAAQEVFLQIFRKAATFRGEARVSTWVYRVAVNRCLNHLRKRRWSKFVSSFDLFSNDGQTSQPDFPSTLDAPDTVLEKSEQVRTVQAAVRALPARQQTAWILHKYHDLSCLEIARILDCSPAAVESLIHRSRRNLEKNLMAVLRKE